MRKKKKSRLFPLFLIALLLPVLFYTSRTAWGILRQSDAEQGAFEALAARVIQNGESDAAPTSRDLAVEGERSGEGPADENERPGEGPAAVEKGQTGESSAAVEKGQTGESPAAVEKERTGEGSADDGKGQSGEGDAPTVARAGRPRITAVSGGEVVTLEPETFDGADGTVAVTDASGARRVEALSSLSDFQGSAVVETETGRATVDFSTADAGAATVEVVDSEENRARVGLDWVLATLAEAEATEAAPREILAQYQPLHDQNPDFFGWLKIEETVIDYPVMFTPEEPEYYLHRSFDGEYSYSGTPFVEGHCSADGSYYIIYAHHMKNGTMFGTLSKYAEQAYWEAHPVIRFDTLYEQRTYQVVAAFKSRIYGEREKGAFRYYAYTDLSDPRVFDEYVSQARAAALYDTGVEIEYGDELLALSTCNYHTQNGRFVVVARRMRIDEETPATAE